MLARRHWIPPAALIFSQLAHGASWVLLAVVAVRAGVADVSGPGLAWVHTVALGWLTMAALGILVHVIPGFTDVQWHKERTVRFTLLPFAAGVVCFVVGWFLSPALVLIGAVVITAAFLCYYLISVWTLQRAAVAGKTEGAIGRALSVNLTFLLAVCLIGVAMSAAIAYDWFPALLARLPAAHANLALYGWFTMLVYGVSARTMRPICGALSRFRWLHVVVASSVVVGPILAAIGITMEVRPLLWLGAIILGAGVVCYSFDTLDIVRRATVSHRPPQAFVVASVVWLVVSTFLGLGLLLGRPWANAYVFTMLVGWVGQMVSAHFLHIGVRLIATIARGDDDETRPASLLDARLSWLCFFTMQAAIALCCYGLLFDAADAVVGGATAGLVAWFATIGNASVAARRAVEITN
ncbi:MAG: hypothetical protein ACYDGM_04180 [Vulcanimicrobiaceae bacterium]